MALYSQGQKVESTGLSIRYAVEASDRSVTDQQGETVIVTVYRVTRYARKEYAYIGLTLEGAKALMNAKIAQYTKNHLQGNRTIQECQASISIDRSGAGYRVNISVNEEDFVSVGVSPTDPANLFSALNNGNYDEEFGTLLKINRVNVWAGSGSSKTFIITYTANIPGADKNAFIAEISDDGGETWRHPRQSTYSDSEVDVYDIAADKRYLVRIVFGGIRSDVVTVSA